VAMLSFAHPHAYTWAEAIQASDDARVVAIWDEDPVRGRAAALRYESEFVADLETALARPGVVAAAVASENARHAEHTVAAAEHGKHVLCEKPMATTLEDCDRMIEAVRRAGVTYFQAFPMRFDPGNHRIRELLARGAIGRVTAVSKRHGHAYAALGWPPELAADNWLLDPRRSGGGALMDEGVHSADWLRWLFGEPESVQASIGPSERLGVEEDSVAVYRFPDGMLATQQSSWRHVASIQTSEIAGTAGTILQRFCDLASSRFAADQGPYPLQLYTVEADRWETLTDVPLHFPTAHQAVARAFLDCLRTGAPPPVTAEDGKRAVQLILAAYASARSGRPVQLDRASSAATSP